MNTRKAFITLGLVLTSIIILPAAHAAERDQASKLTFSRSVPDPRTRIARGEHTGSCWPTLLATVTSFTSSTLIDQCCMPQFRRLLPSVWSRPTTLRSLSPSEI